MLNESKGFKRRAGEFSLQGPAELLSTYGKGQRPSRDKGTEVGMQFSMLGEMFSD